jgi:hypothetical protein
MELLFDCEFFSFKYNLLNDEEKLNFPVPEFIDIHDNCYYITELSFVVINDRESATEHFGVVYFQTNIDSSKRWSVSHLLRYQANQLGNRFNYGSLHQCNVMDLFYQILETWEISRIIYKGGILEELLISKLNFTVDSLNLEDNHCPPSKDIVSSLRERLNCQLFQCFLHGYRSSNYYPADRRQLCSQYSCETSCVKTTATQHCSLNDVYLYLCFFNPKAVASLKPPVFYKSEKALQYLK